MLLNHTTNVQIYYYWVYLIIGQMTDIFCPFLSPTPYPPGTVALAGLIPATLG
jgi:hypothetical protein